MASDAQEKTGPEETPRKGIVATGPRVERRFKIVRGHPTKYVVQYEFPDPVNNPGDKVSKKCVKGVVTYFVPISRPDAHNLGYEQLVAMTDLQTVIPIIHNP